MGIDFSKVYGDQEEPQKSGAGRKPQTKQTPARGKSLYAAALGADESEEAPARGRGRTPARRDDESEEAPARGRGRGRGRSQRDDASEEAPARGRSRARRDDDASEEAPARGRGRARRDDASDEAPRVSSRRGKASRDDASEEVPVRGRRRTRKPRHDESSAEAPALERDDADDEGEPRPRSRRARRQDGRASRAREESARLAAAKARPLVDDGKVGGEFRQFGLCLPLLRAIDDMGWTGPSPIQELVLPVAVTGVDVVGQARTGTGKTGAFAIPLIDQYATRPEELGAGRLPVALVLSPTRELALQIYRQLEQLGSYTKLRSVAVYGGAPMEPQLRALRAGADIVVGTPGRVMDHIRRSTLRLDEVTTFILDEADRMFDLGFRDDIYWVSRRLPEERQTMLLSATMPDEIVKLAEEVTNHPELIYTTQGKEEEQTVDTIEQFYASVDPQRKIGLLEHLVALEEPEKGIVFTRTKRGADRVAERLRKAGFDAGEIHSDLRQKQRERILERFREGDLQLMIATDVAARGLDIQGVTHVFNFDVPQHAEDYVHRVGRTARMGRTGRAITFVTKNDGTFLNEIDKLINKQVPYYPIEGYRTEANAEEKARSEERENRGRPPGEHPFAKNLSPALQAILAKSAAKPGGRGGRGGPGGGRGGPSGGRKGRGRGSR